MNQDAQDLETVQAEWESQWADALRIWSPYVQLHAPLWCHSDAAAREQGLTGSFAMIRLVDHSIVINLHQIAEQGLTRFAREILAHEIGHHVLCPADLSDNARLLARIRRGLPGVESYAPMISNLYSDLMINDRLQRASELDIAGVYRQLETESSSTLWLLYMRIYELLWRLPPQTLAIGKIKPRLNQDAQLGARLVRSYAHDWLGGGGRFACLCFPYVEEEQAAFQKAFQVWCDAITAGAGGFPDGLSAEDEDEASSTIHPSEDPYLSGIAPSEDSNSDSSPAAGSGRVLGRDSGNKSSKQSRGPLEYAEILKASGVTLSPRELAIKFYKERAVPHLIPFPVSVSTTAVDPIPEGLDGWEVSEPMEQIDWWSTLLTSPEAIIPGVTTRKRLSGDSPGSDPERRPIDLYLGVDCSGSMRDPALNLSYPILAGTIMVLSALRAGARVKVVLSGEPGSSISTDGFTRNANECLQVLTNYLGTGYAFGIHRLAETFDQADTSDRPVHILVLSDSDMFIMLEESASGRSGWDIARQAQANCHGGASYVLQIPAEYVSMHDSKHCEHMRSDGWNVHLVNSMEELLLFAKQFSRAQYTRHATDNRSPKR